MLGLVGFVVFSSFLWLGYVYLGEIGEVVVSVIGLVIIVVVYIINYWLGKCKFVLL